VKGQAPHAVDGWGLWGQGGRYGALCEGVSTPTAIGVLARGRKSAMILESMEGSDPRSRADAHTKGEIEPDSAGNMWVCVVRGIPGTWRRLAGPSTAGAFVPVTPKRVFDSRWADFGPTLTTGSARTVNVADGRTLAGEIDLTNLVPAGATAIQFTLTCTNTVARGFLAATPGGTTTYSASSINWTGASQVIANTTMTTVDAARNIKLYCGGSGASTDAIVDIVGYFL